MSIKTLASLVSAAACTVAFCNYGGRISLDKKDALYQSGDTAVCSVTLTKDGKPLKGVKARMILKWETKVIETKDFETTGKPVKFSYKGEKPGWAYFGFQVLGDDGKPLSGKGVFKHRRKPTIVTEIGAIFDADKIVSPVREPADFDEFWAKRVSEVKAAPMEPELTELKSRVKGIRLFAVKLPVVRGIMASGYLAFPAKAKPQSLPAYIYFQSLTNSDVPPGYAVEQAKKGALAFAATWHGFPVGKDAKYYEKVIPPYSRGATKNIGDKEKWVNSDMFFRVLRELEFIKSRPEWDGRNLVSNGGSLGGIQSACATALDPQVSLAVISVPGGCECNAYEAGRRPYGVFRRLGAEKLKADPKYIEMGFYYDAVNFAKRFKCPVYVCTGFADETCYPSNVYAFYNAIPETVKKVMCTNPRTGHFGTTKNVNGDAQVQKLFKAVMISELPKN